MAVLRSLLIGTVTAAAAFALRLALVPLLGYEAPFLAAIVAAFVAALLGGFPAGLTAGLLSAVAGLIWLIAPVGELTIAQTDDAWALGFFVVLATGAAWLAASWRNARRRAESEATQATTALREHETLGAAIYHDLQQPLSIIELRAQLLERRLAAEEPDREEMSRHLAAILSAARNAEQLVGELIDASLLRAGAVPPLATQPANVAELVRGLVAEYQHAEASHAVEFRSEADETVIQTDPVRLVRVVRNLVDNAIKYSPSGSSVQIVLGVRGTRAPAIDVIDQGSGVPEGERERIFAATYRARRPDSVPGIGLGLWGSRRIMRLLGGDVTLTATHSTGSTFTIHLPETRPEQGEATTSSRREDGPAPRHAAGTRPLEAVTVRRRADGGLRAGR